MPRLLGVSSGSGSSRRNRFITHHSARPSTSTGIIVNLKQLVVNSVKGIKFKLDV